MLKFLSGLNSEQRLRELHAIADGGIALDIIQCLMDLPLSEAEKISLINAAKTDTSVELEHFLLSLMQTETQNIAAAALRVFIHKTQRLLWHELQRILCAPHASQRLKYRLIEATTKVGGQVLFENFLQSEASITEYAPAFHRLILLRATQFGVVHPYLDEIVDLYLNQTEREDHRNEQYALIYLMSKDPKIAQKWLFSQKLESPWDETFFLLAARDFSEKVFLKNLRTALPHGKQKMDLLFRQEWVVFWQRSAITPDFTESVLREIYDHVIKDSGFSDYRLNPSDFLGIANIEDIWCRFALAVKASDEAPHLDILAGFLRDLSPLIMYRSSPGPGLKRVSEVIQDDLLHYTKILPSSFLAALFFNSRLKKGLEGLPKVKIEKDGRIIPPKIQANFLKDQFPAFYSQMTQESCLENIEPLCQEGRRLPYVLQMFYIRKLGTFKNEKAATLKLLDFVHTQDEPFISEVIHAMAKLHEPRATRELISLITRPQVKAYFRLEICAILKDHDLSHFQSDIKAAIQRISRESMDRGIKFELLEQLDGLIDTAVQMRDWQGGMSPASTDSLSDDWLVERVPVFPQLSSEVQRSLRTAQFFHQGLMGKSDLSHIDLSPIVDMQYKALELFFRERFDAPCRYFVESGSLQKKLDLIGYARPIEEKMTQFENYLISLPQLRDVPFFSKFKLRKLLRGICTFRPGRRFTLDGLKAFGLFFAVFSRQQDNYGLRCAVESHWKDDARLLAFAAQCHIFQDLRNRAAHEGFESSADNEIDAVWEKTAHLFNEASQFDIVMTESKKTSAAVIIEKKKKMGSTQ